MSVFPKYGRERYVNKAAIHGGISSGFIVPGSPSRATTQGWKVRSNGVNVDTLTKLDKIRAGSRDLFMNTPIAVGALQRIKTNVIGQGLKLQSSIDWKTVGISREQAEAWQRDVETKWLYWCTKEADIRRAHTFEELQALALLSQMLSGDCFALLPHITPNRGQLFNLRVQLIEADYISNPNSKPDTEELAGGIQVDRYGAPLRYFMKVPSNKSQSIYLNNPNGVGRWEEIPAVGAASGRKNILHLYKIDRPGQRRGIPILAPLLLPLKNIGRLSDAEVTGALVASMFTVFVKNSPTNSLNPQFDPSQSVIQNDPNKEYKYELAPGAVVGLAEGQDIEIAKPERPSNMFVPAFETFVKEFAMALQVPYEVLMLNYGQSYSASKAALLEAWKFFTTERSIFATKFCQEVYEAWLVNAIQLGHITAPGFLEDPFKRAAWSKCRWNGPGIGQINPLDETKAAVLRLQAGLSTHETEHAAIYGTDWESAARSLARERDLKQDLGIPEVSLNGQLQEDEVPRNTENNGEH